MLRNKTPNPNKARKLEKKGDELFKKGKFEKALQQYRESEKLDPERAEIYQKLSQTLEKVGREWTQEDFEESMSWTMRQQELEHPEIKWVHEKFTTDYQAVQKLVQQLMLLQDTELEQQIITQILSFEAKATLPLLDFLVSLKTMAHKAPASPVEEP
jgi:tetratricopeptide (TPR) repeat protein